MDKTTEKRKEDRRPERQTRERQEKWDERHPGQTGPVEPGETEDEGRPRNKGAQRRKAGNQEDRSVSAIRATAAAAVLPLTLWVFLYSRTAHFSCPARRSATK